MLKACYPPVLEPPSYELSNCGSRTPPAGLPASGIAGCLLLLLSLAAPLIGAEQPALPPAAGLTLLDAVELALVHDPNIAVVEARLDAAEGSRLAISSRFDPALTASLFADDTRTATGEDSFTTSDGVQASAGMRYELRSGLILEPALSLTRNGDSGPGPDSNQASVSFSLRQPLLRGRGRDVVTSDERAAEVEVQASELDLEHTVSLRLRAVAELYWRLRAAQVNLDILHQSEARSRTLLETTRRLIEADITPAAEIIQLQADLAAKEAARISGEQTLFAARQALGREIGLLPAGIQGLPPAATPFPDAPLTPTDRTGASYIRRALSERQDLRAAYRRVEAARVQTAGASDALKPTLDLVLTPSYSGFVDGDAAGEFVSPLYRNVPGISTTFGLSLTLPVGRRQAAGRLLQSESAERQSRLQADLLERAIGADVPTALDAVARSTEQLERARSSEELFEQAVTNEEKKLRAGRSTLLDVINQRDRLTAAQQQRIGAHLTLALALLELRFQTGTLWQRQEASDSRPSISIQQLTTLPLATQEPVQEGPV